MAVYFVASVLLVTALFGARLLVTGGWTAPIPRAYLVEVVNALIILVTGYVVSFFVERYLFRHAGAYPGLRRQATVRFLIRLLIYLAVVLAVLGAFGVKYSSALFGGAFLTVVLGLAGQTVLANLLAGVVLVLTRPFETGDRIAFMTWQFPVLVPSYPHPALPPFHSGEIVDVKIMHTSLRTGDGVVLLIPNGILIQAAIQNLSRTPVRRVDFRFDVEVSLDPVLVEKSLSEALGAEAWVVTGSCRVSFVDLGPQAYSMAVAFESSGLPPEEAKSAAMKKVLLIVRELSGQAAERRSSPP